MLYKKQPLLEYVPLNPIQICTLTKKFWEKLIRYLCGGDTVCKGNNSIWKKDSVQSFPCLPQPFQVSVNRARVGVTSVKVSWTSPPVPQKRGSRLVLVVSAIWSNAEWTSLGDRRGLTPVRHQSSWTFPVWFPWHPDELWSAYRWIRVTRWCRCRQRWWPASWEWSQWCPAWPGCSPPCFPCLGFPFPHHCGECWPFSQEKSALFVSNRSGVNRQQWERETQSICRPFFFQPRGEKKKSFILLVCVFQQLLWNLNGFHLCCVNIQLS